MTCCSENTVLAHSPETIRRVRQLMGRFGGKTHPTDKDIVTFFERLVDECAMSVNDPTTMLHQAVRQAAR